MNTTASAMGAEAVCVELNRAGLQRVDLLGVQDANIILLEQLDG